MSEYPKRILEITTHDRPHDGEEWQLRAGTRYDEKSAHYTSIGLTPEDMEKMAEVAASYSPTVNVVRVEKDRGGSGEVIRLFSNSVLVWSHIAAVDGPLSDDAQSLLSVLSK